jgi:hypothetical protein
MPATDTGQEPASAGAADALRRARAFGRQLAPTEDLRLKVEFRHRRQTPVGFRGDEWMVSSNEDGAAGRFAVVFDAQTAAIKRLSWAGNAHESRNGGGEGIGRKPLSPARNILDRDRAVGAARGCIRLLGIPGAGGPWVVEKCRMDEAASIVYRRMWCVHLASSRWSAFLVIDGATAELSQVLVLPVGRAVS